MNKDFDAVEPDGKKVMRLNEFEALIHHRCRIDADLGAHRPVRVRDRLRGGDACHIGGTHRAEWAAAGGQDDPAHLIDPSARQTLKDRIMLAVDRQDRGARGAGNRRHQFARRHQRFLIGQRNVVSGRQGGHCWRETRGADDRGHDEVGRTLRDFNQRLGTGGDFDAGVGQRGLEIVQPRGVGDDRHVGAKFLRQLCQFGDIAVGGEHRDAPRRAIAPHEVEGRLPDRPGGTKERKAALRHLSPPSRCSAVRHRPTHPAATPPARCRRRGRTARRGRGSACPNP